MLSIQEHNKMWKHTKISIVYYNSGMLKQNEHRILIALQDEQTFLIRTAMPTHPANWVIDMQILSERIQFSL